jgi:transcriptional regulator with XRE-family HTH domain
MAETFGSFLRTALERKNLGVCEYARLAGYPKAHGFVSRVLSGSSLPPLKELKRWAAPLDLDAKAYQRFELLAGIAHASPAVQAWFESVDGKRESS